MIYQGDTVRVTQLEQGFAELVLDAQEGKANILNKAALADLRAAVDAVKSQPDIKCEREFRAGCRYH